MAKILLVEDDPEVSMSVAGWLSDVDNHAVETVFEGIEALSRLVHYSYDLLILDWDLPGLSGIEVLRRLRSSGNKIPVLFLTGKTATADKVEGLTSGSDDYLTKPFHMKELSARVLALLRRGAGLSGNCLLIQDIVVDVNTKRVQRDGNEIELSRKEFDVFLFLLSHANQYFSSEELLQRVWSSESDATTEAVRQCIMRMRSKLDKKGKPSIIQSAPRMGYRVSND